MCVMAGFGCMCHHRLVACSAALTQVDSLANDAAVACTLPANAVQALTSNDLEEQAYILRTMLKLQCGNGLMHESVSTQNLAQCTRPVFEWANAMLVRHACTAAQHPHTSGCKPVSLKKQLPGRTVAGDTAYLLTGPAGLLLQHQLRCLPHCRCLPHSRCLLSFPAGGAG